MSCVPACGIHGCGRFGGRLLLRGHIPCPINERKPVERSSPIPKLCGRGGQYALARGVTKHRVRNCTSVSKRAHPARLHLLAENQWLGW
eukprot:2563867-Prymnesium_polylepis.1